MSLNVFFRCVCISRTCYNEDLAGPAYGGLVVGSGSDRRGIFSIAWRSGRTCSFRHGPRNPEPPNLGPRSTPENLRLTGTTLDLTAPISVLISVIIFFQP